MIGNLLTLITVTAAFGAVAVLIPALLSSRARVRVRADERPVRVDASRDL